MKIALASPPFPESINTGLVWIEKLVEKAAKDKAEIICFPESYIPGYSVMTEFSTETPTIEILKNALDKVCQIAAKNEIAVIIPMDWYLPEGLANLAFVISNKGEILGYQTKNQLDPTEDNVWIPGTTRQIFEVNGVKFGITICHEGFRYPESVRWAAQNGAKIVFHPHFGGSNIKGTKLTEWGSKNNPYYEKAMMMRALENTIYFASANCAFNYPDSASSVIAPDGTCIAHETYGKPGVLIAEIEPELATGFLAKRFKNNLYA